MNKVTVTLLRPLNGAEIGSTAEYSPADAKRLEATGAVRIHAAKKAPAPKNKMQQPPANKAEGGSETKTQA